MWNVYRWADKDIVEEEGYVIYPKNSWYLIGDYDTIDAAANIVKHEIYLYNCTCRDEDPNPKFKIESNLE